MATFIIYTTDLGRLVPVGAVTNDPLPLNEPVAVEEPPDNRPVKAKEGLPTKAEKN